MATRINRFHRRQLLRRVPLSRTIQPEHSCSSAMESIPGDVHPVRWYVFRDLGHTANGQRDDRPNAIERIRSPNRSSVWTRQRSTPVHDHHALRGHVIWRTNSTSDRRQRKRPPDRSRARRVQFDHATGTGQRRPTVPGPVQRRRTGRAIGLRRILALANSDRPKHRSKLVPFGRSNGEQLRAAKQLSTSPK